MSVASNIYLVLFSLGAGHDGDNVCTGGINIMAVAVPGGEGALKWSSCTRNLLQTFLRSVIYREIPVNYSCPLKLLLLKQLCAYTTE